MKTSEAGLAFVANEEGTVLHVYIDQVGVPTIGVGHALLPGESFPNGITLQQALDILARDINESEKAVNSGVKVALTQNQFDALVSFTFNVGKGAFASSTLLKKLNAGDAQGAADEFLRWTKGGGKVVPVLVKRRARERALFLKDVSTVVDPTPVSDPVKPADPATPAIPPDVPTQPSVRDPAPIVPSPVPSPPARNPIWDFIMTIINLFFKRGK